MSQEEKYKRELETLKEDFNDLKLYLDELRAILPIAICTLSSFGNIVDINKAAEILTEYKPLEIIGQPVIIIFKEKQKIKTVMRAAGKGKDGAGEMTLMSKNKKEIPVSVAMTGRKDPQKNVIGYFLTIADIAEAKKYQDQLKTKTQELQKRVEELEEFHQITVGRELKMVELKKEVKKLGEELKRCKPRP